MLIIVVHVRQEVIMKKPKIIGFIQSKGGSGKTTSSMSTLGGLMEAGKSVCLFDIDADEPDSHTWSRNGEYFTNVYKVNHKDLRQKIEVSCILSVVLLLLSKLKLIN